MGFTFCLTAGSRAEASFAGGDGVEGNKAFTLLAVIWQPADGENRMSIIITVVILTTIIIIIIITANQKAEERCAERLVSEACTADYRLNLARLQATNGLHYPKCVSE